MFVDGPNKYLPSFSVAPENKCGIVALNWFFAREFKLKTFDDESLEILGDKRIDLG